MNRTKVSSSNVKSHPRINKPSNHNYSRFVADSKDELDEADTLNEIEGKVMRGEPVSDRERNLLIESYVAFGVGIPSNVYRKLKLE